MAKPWFNTGDLVRLRPRTALKTVTARKRHIGLFHVKSILPELHGVNGQYQYRLVSPDGTERIGLESELASAVGAPRFRP
jgi:hypothetical protein